MSLCTGAFIGDILGGSVYDLVGFRWCCSIEGFIVGGMVSTWNSHDAIENLEKKFFFILLPGQYGETYKLISFF